MLYLHVKFSYAFLSAVELGQQCHYNPKSNCQPTQVFHLIKELGLLKNTRGNRAAHPVRQHLINSSRKIDSLILNCCHYANWRPLRPPWGIDNTYVALQLSSVVVMSSHLITNRMWFYFFQSKCVVNMSSACHFLTRGGMQCKIVRQLLRIPLLKFENFMGYLDTFWDTSDWWKIKILVVFLSVKY